MAKDKGKRINPATAALKAAKNKTIKKAKNQLAQQRAEKLARRNPDRLQRQIDQLTEEREWNGGKLRPRDEKMLEELERDVGRIRKARNMVGSDEKEGGERRGGDRDREGVLGKRGRDGNRRPEFKRESSSETDDDVRYIPMPSDIENMPPLPRKPRFNNNNNNNNPSRMNPSTDSLPVPVAQTTYSSAPQLRNLQKEAISRFMPTIVANKLAAVKGEAGKLLEPEEADQLEREGYRAAEQATKEAEKEVQYRLMGREAVEGAAGSLEEEERRFEEEVRMVEDELGLEDDKEEEVDEDIQGFVGEAEEEVQYRLMMREQQEGVARTKGEQVRRFEQEARKVEIEEVSDEDL